MASKKNKQRGQGLVEYLLITVFVAIASIAAIQFVGQTLRYKFAQIGHELGGQAPGISAPRAGQGLTERKDIRSVFDN